MLEPMFIFINCYTAYLIAELLDLSAILSIIFCAFVMMDRSEGEMSAESHVVVKYRFANVLGQLRITHSDQRVINY